VVREEVVAVESVDGCCWWVVFVGVGLVVISLLD
jgi:hypothetical protein